MNETDPRAPFPEVFPHTPRYGVRLPPGFNGSQKDVVDALFEMTSETIQTNKLFYGWTITLERSEVGEWRYSIEPK